jgi:hypothetical protein
VEAGYEDLDVWNVVIDTSAIHHDFDLTNHETAILLQQADRHGLHICIPEVVVQEMASHCLDQFRKTTRDLDDARRFLNRVLVREVRQLYRPEEMTRAATAYEAVLRRRLRALGVEILRLPRGERAMRDLLQREQLRRKPFKPDGQGLRDVLLWESVLDLCRREPRPGALVTANTRDFADESTRTQLHQHLVMDLRTVGVRRAELYTSIGAVNSAPPRGRGAAI